MGLTLELHIALVRRSFFDYPLFNLTSIYLVYIWQKNLEKSSVKESDFGKFTDWSIYIFSFDNSDSKRCNIYIYSQTVLPKNYLWWENWNTSSKFRVNYFLAMQICETQLKFYVSKELLLHKTSANFRRFHIHQFSQATKNLLFATVYFLRPHKNIYFCKFNSVN